MSLCAFVLPLFFGTGGWFLAFAIWGTLGLYLLVLIWNMLGGSALNPRDPR